MRVKVVAIDGWTALNAYVPPPERRGLVLVDPPFEAADDFARLARGLEAAHRKWTGGIYLMWYPIKGRHEPDTLARRLARSGIAKILRVELTVAQNPNDTQMGDTQMRREGPLGSCGLIVVNPPWPLAGELATLLPELAAILSGAGAGSHRLDWLAGEC